MSKNLKTTFGALATAVASMPFVALAELQPVEPITNLTQIAPPETDQTITSANAILRIFGQILGYVQAFFWLAAVFTGLYAAFLYLTAGGDGEKITKANHMLIYTVVAVIVAVISYSIPAFVKTTIAS